EALTLSDRIVVMRAGAIEQIGTPEALYDRPSTRFVANFLGEANVLDDPRFRVEADSAQPSGTVAMIRPERIRIADAAASVPVDAELRQSVAGVVVETIYAGPLRKYLVRAGSLELAIRQHVAAAQSVFQPGSAVRLDWLRSDIRFVES
ncbi:MAG: TOBE domain-containing protein, partial [Mesorhizobium sp.]